MKDYVSFETAKRLKEAGYPQPERFAEHQAFYRLSATVRTAVDLEPRIESETFAPSATDILNQLPAHSLRFNGDVFSCTEWDFSGSKEFEYEVNKFKHPNPAEACAAAWLSVHEKSANQ